MKILHFNQEYMSTLTYSTLVSLLEKTGQDQKIDVGRLPLLHVHVHVHIHSIKSISAIMIFVEVGVRFSSRYHHIMILAFQTV